MVEEESLWPFCWLLSRCWRWAAVFKKSMSPGAGAAETTAANATEAVREEGCAASHGDRKEDETAPAAEENEERAADGPGADTEDAAESGAGVQDIEAFAERIQEAVADRDMETLADLGISAESGDRRRREDDI